MEEGSQVFEERWNFPHCLGAMDGKHITITPPSGSGSELYNYKGRYSVVLLAIVNANYQFLMCDFGTNGRISDGEYKLLSNLLNIPPEETVRNSSRPLPYVFVVDDAFPLRPDMLKPFRKADLTSTEKKIYNYRVSRARSIVENAFGILATRFRIFHTQLNLEPENIESVVMETCVLHNFLMKSVQSYYSPPECFDRENTDDGTTATGFHTGNYRMDNLDRRNADKIANAEKKSEKLL
ncbi:hypothetical protein B7P43_G12463 [Cryptotermes secundus]|uniref:DDE Tnp4 domain-containing protein n=1 Tax=Cryptotermes secundus TaxID=105785 RepID=A0A2J7PHA7_9NEOP|nr:hypothetical protein B7P43_G12463 [Cryptotermes secundus]